MLFLARNSFVGFLLLLESTFIIINGAEPPLQVENDVYNASQGKNDDAIKFQAVQNRILDIVGNSSNTMNSMSQIMALLHSDAGKELGKLVVEGFMLGIKQKDAINSLGEFWLELQFRLPPTIKGTLKDYQDFFKGIDIRTLPLLWEELFRKDALGNSVAGMPLGQIIDMVHPVASKYGIDIRALMDSVMGKGDNNLRDLITAAIDNTNFTSLWNRFLNTTTSMFQITEAFKTSKSKPQKDKTEKTLHLFRPLVTSLLKDNEVDLDADAVLQVLSPLFKTDFLSSFTPLLSLLSTQGDGGVLGELIGNIMGGTGRGPKANPMAGIMGALGGLMATSGGKNQMDMTTMLNLASAFLDTPSKKGTKTKPDKKGKTRENNGLDLGSLVNMAGSLMGNMDMSTILDIAAASLKDEDLKAKSPHTKSKLKAKQEKAPQQAPKVAPKTKKEASAKYKKSPKHFIDIIEPILRSMKKDKKCNAKIRDAIDLGKNILTNKLSSVGGFKQIIPLLLSFISNEEFLKSQSVNIDQLTSSFTQALAYANWNEFFIMLEDEGFREGIIQNILPYAADLVTIVAAEETQKKINDAVIPRFQMFAAAYGLTGITLDNFPERLAPMLGLASKSWKLPFNPTTSLVPLKVYLKGLQSWAVAGLQEIKSMTPEEVKILVKDKLENDISESIVNVLSVTRETSDLQCLPQRLCDINSGLKPNSLQASVTRLVSLVSAAGPVLQSPDSDLMIRTVEAISDTYEDCQ
ncbi:hypothetical protein SK128_009406, partial [Halocaridina rubra]